jgi:hypothetical protein
MYADGSSAQNVALNDQLLHTESDRMEIENGISSKMSLLLFQLRNIGQLTNLLSRDEDARLHRSPARNSELAFPA